MNIRLDVIGNIKVNHVTDAIDIESARRHIGRDKNMQLPTLEFCQGARANRLALVAMDRGGVNPVKEQLCSQLVGREMIKRKGGKIINISSMVSQQERPIQSVYAAAKAGVSRLTQSFAAEWAKYNINVNAIAPGVTLSDMNKKYFEEHPKEFKNRISSIPKGREAYPSDYVGAAIFFASDASDYVTGQILFVDGGSTL